jgi:HD-GYP domain-containing protein (c-di-GMP phosphodiesterase class II)
VHTDNWTWKGVSAEFERFVLVLVASLALYRIVPSLFAPGMEHIPDAVLLSVTLFVVGYLWLRRTSALSDLLDAQNSLRDAHVGAVGALVHALEAKDEYTQGHSERVRCLSVVLAGKLGLDEERVGVVSRAAALHDLGKLAVPDAILHKKEPLTPDEQAILENHPRRTADILSTLGFLEKESRVALLHHERHDGSGYCMGLKGDEIPLEVAIIAIVDMFDAMNSRRPYRDRLPAEKIRAELKQVRGIKHSPAVVDALLELLAAHPDLWGPGSTAERISEKRE